MARRARIGPDGSAPWFWFAFMACSPRLSCDAFSESVGELADAPLGGAFGDEQPVGLFLCGASADDDSCEEVGVFEGDGLVGDAVGEFCDDEFVAGEPVRGGGFDGDDGEGGAIGVGRVAEWLGDVAEASVVVADRSFGGVDECG